MKSKCRLGDIITQRREKFSGEMLPICGVTREGFIPPKQKDADVSLYNVFYKNDFVFNPARMELNSIVFNDIYEKAMCSSLYEVFYVNRPDLVLPEFLALIVKQNWFFVYISSFLLQPLQRHRKIPFNQAIFCSFQHLAQHLWAFHDP